MSQLQTATVICILFHKVYSLRAQDTSFCMSLQTAISHLQSLRAGASHGYWSLLVWGVCIGFAPKKAHRTQKDYCVRKSVGNCVVKGSVSRAKNRLVQWGVTISDGIETPNSLHLDCKILVRLQEDCEVTISKSFPSISNIIACY